MRYALVRDNLVQTILIANEGQKKELEEALNAELVDASEQGLSVGDLMVNGVWTRNVNGEQVPVVKVVDAEERLDEVEAAIIELASLMGGGE